MKNVKNLSKRGLALFLALVMCLGMVQFTAFAEEPESQEPAVVDTVEIPETDPVVVDEQLPVIDDEEQPPVVNDEQESEIPEEPAEAPDESTVTPEEPIEVPDASVEVPEEAQKPDEVINDAASGTTGGVIEEVMENIPDEIISANAVQMFLNAVDAIEVPEEDLLLEENTDLAESFGDAVWAAYGLWEGLTEAEQELEEVDVAFQELQNMVMVLPDYAASMYALSSVTVSPDYDTGSCIPGVTRFGGSVTKAVGEDGFYKRRAVHNFYCPTCGYFFGQSTAKEYANIQWQQSLDGVNDDDIIDNVSFKVGTLDGYQCLEMDFTGANAGTTLVTLQYDVNFHTRWNSGYAACPACGVMTSVDQYDDNWYHYEDQFYVTVSSNDSSSHTYWVYVPTNGTDNGYAVVDITRPYLDTRYSGGAVLAEIRNPKLEDKDGINGVYADIATRLTGQLGGSGPNYEVEMTVTGLDKPTPEGEYVSVYVSYTYYQYNSYSTNYLVSGSWTDEVRIVVYDPQTVPLKVGETLTHQYKGNSAFGNYFVFNQQPTSSDSSIVQVKNASNTSSHQVTGMKSSEGEEITVTSNFTRYQYKYNKVYGTNTSSPNRYVPDFAFTPNLTYVDTVKYTVSDSPATTTPVTIVKEFDGITEDQIPDNFALTYTITGCNTCGTQTGTLNKADATVTNSDGMTRLVWNVTLPVAAHGTNTHTITFTESNATVSGFKTPTLTGNVVTLESLTVEDDAPEGTKPVITLTNRYEPEDDVYVLSYDGMGGTNCPATQVVKKVAASHTFNVAGAEDEIKIPVNKGYTFLGWAWTERATTPDFKYDSAAKTYAPATTTLTQDAPSKTLYAVWKLDKPDAPTASDVNKLLPVPGHEANSVTVICQPGVHKPSYFTCAKEGRLEIGDVKGSAETGYTCEVTFPGQVYVNAYSTNPDLNKGHHDWVTQDGTAASASDDNVTITLTWNAETEKWEAPKDVAPVVFYATCKQHVEGQPFLSITKSVDKTSVNLGDPVTYTITVSNTGTADASNVKVVDPLSNMLKWTGAMLKGAAITPDTNGSYTIGEVKQGESVVLTITAKATQDGTIENTAYLNPKDPSNPDKEGDNEGSSSSDPITVAGPELNITKENDGFQWNTETETAYVNYTVTVTNKSGFSLYGLRLTDVMEQPDVSKVNPADEGKVGVNLTFKDWKVQTTADGEFTAIEPTSTSEDDLTHVLQLLNRNVVFANGQTVTLTYTVEITSQNEDIAVNIKLDNKAKAGSWTETTSGASTLAARAISLFSEQIMPLDDTIDTDEPNVSAEAGSTTGGGTPGSSASGTIPAKHTVTYSWNLPEGANGTLPIEGNHAEGYVVTVDIQYTNESTITVDGKTYTFSGWSTSDAEVEDGKFTMPDKNVTLTGTWTEKEAPKPGTPVQGKGTLTITKKFVGLTKDQVPQDFYMTYTANSVKDGLYSDSGRIELTSEDGLTFTGTIPLPAWKFSGDSYQSLEGDYRTIVTITEHNAAVDGYKCVVTSSSDERINGYVITTSSIGAATVGTTRTITNTYTKNTTPVEPSNTVHYIVEWYEAGKTEPFKTDMSRAGKIGDTVSTTDADKVIEGYTFDAENSGNVLEGTLKEIKSADDIVTLKLYFTKDETTTPEDKVTVTWRPGYGDNAPIKTESVDKDSDYSSLYPADPSRPGYTFIGWSDPVTDEDGNITITAQWRANSSSGGNGGGGSRPTPTPTPDPDPDVEIPDENPPLIDTPDVEIPDVETPDVDIPDEEPPLAEIPDEEPPLANISDGNVPLANVPQTGDSSLLWLMTAGIAGAGLVWLTLSKKREDDAE